MNAYMYSGRRPTQQVALSRIPAGAERYGQLDLGAALGAATQEALQTVTGQMVTSEPAPAPAPAPQPQQQAPMAAPASMPAASRSPDGQSNLSGILKAVPMPILLFGAYWFFSQKKTVKGSTILVIFVIYLFLMRNNNGS